MNIATYEAIVLEACEGQFSWDIRSGIVTYRELTLRSGRGPGPEIDVTMLIDSLEGLPAHKIVTACSDYLYDRTCNDCKEVGEHEYKSNGMPQCETCHDDAADEAYYNTVGPAEYYGVAGEF